VLQAARTQIHLNGDEEREARRKETCLRRSFDDGIANPTNCNLLSLGPPPDTEGLRDLAFEDLARAISEASL
jgi:hypothetical protein